MKYVAVLGFGTVGSGVVEIIENNGFNEKTGDTVKVKAILDLREFPESPYASLITHNFEDILNDSEIEIVVETMGGVRAAYDFTRRSLEMGKSVVTSNKELVSTYGTELMQIARDNNACYFFEASVGGGIPIIRPLNMCLAGNNINSILGILNGTTNFILTKMIAENMDFADALKLAQENGYAEADPTADIEGYDTRRKVAILASLAYGKYVDSNEIKTEGITKVSIDDINSAIKAGYAIKLIGQCKKTNDKVFAKVSPMLIPKSVMLSNVNDVFNAVVVNGDATGDVMFYGKGAGKLATASAVVGDILDIIIHEKTGAPKWNEGGIITDENPDKTKYFIRLENADLEYINKTFKPEYMSSEENVTSFITNKGNDCELKELISKLDNVKSCIEVYCDID